MAMSACAHDIARITISKPGVPLRSYCSGEASPDPHGITFEYVCSTRVTVLRIRTELPWIDTWSGWLPAGGGGGGGGGGAGSVHTYPATPSSTHPPAWSCCTSARLGVYRWSRCPLPGYQCSR